MSDRDQKQPNRRSAAYSLEDAVSLWGDAVAADASPGMSIKAGGAEARSSAESRLLLRKRRVADAGSGTAESEKQDFEVAGVLGEGGMGVVFSARQASLDRDVAVKMVRAERADDVKSRRKFLAEAMVTGELNHPNIVPIYDLGATRAGELFYAMKEVKGTPWSQVIRDKTETENLEILLKVCDAVAFAHDRGVIHRDLKPENVMLGDYGEVLVMDWGLAASRGGPEGCEKAVQLTESSGRAGTPAYMAPEMALCEWQKIGPASDVYLLGGILYEIVVGLRPHAGRAARECICNAMSNELQPAQTEGELVDIALRALTAEPEGRYASAKEFQLAIRDYQEHAESLKLSSAAEIRFAQLDQAGESEEYRECTEIIAGYQQALELWPLNRSAIVGLRKVRERYAETALDRGELALARSEVAAMEAECERYAIGKKHLKRPEELAKRVELAVAQVVRKDKAARITRWAAAAAALLVVVVSTGGYFSTKVQRDRAVAEEKKAVEAQKGLELAQANIVGERDKAVAAEKKATEAEKRAKVERDKAVGARNALEQAQANIVGERDKAVAAEKKALAAQAAEAEERKKATEAEKVAKVERDKAVEAQKALKLAQANIVGERDKAVAAEKKATEAERLAKADRDRAQQALAEMRAAKEAEVAAKKETEKVKDIAETEKIELVTQRDRSASQRDRGSYCNAIALAQRKIDEALFARAESLLWRTRRELRGWEWGWLMSLCRPDLVTLKGHSRMVESVAFSPGGKRVATASSDKTAKIWDAATGQGIVTLRGHSASVESVVFSPDGKRVATGSLDNTAKIWDTATGQEIRTLKGHSEHVRSVTFSPDGKRVATGSYDETAKIWDAATGQEIMTLKGPLQEIMTLKVLSRGAHAVNSVAFSPDGKRVATGSFDKTAKIWDAATGQEIMALKGHSASVNSVAFSADGKRVATGSEDKTAKIWDGATGQGIVTLRGHSASVESVVFPPDGKRVATGSEDKTAKIWDAGTGLEIRTLQGHSHNIVGSVAFSPDGKRVATGSWDRTAKIWDAATGEEIITLRGHSERSGWRGIGYSVAFSPDGKRVATGSEDKTAKIWDAATGQKIMTLKGHSDNIVGPVAFSPDGKRVATGSFDKTAKIWDAATGKEILTMKGHSGWVESVAFSPDGKRVATGSNDKTAKIWDAATGKEILTMKGHSASVESVAFPPDGKRVVTGSPDGTAKIWDAGTGLEIMTLEVLSWGLHAVHSVAFSPDGKRVATGSIDNTAKIWDTATGQEIRTLKGHSETVNSVTFSPDGKRVATVSYDGIAIIWEALDWTISTPEEVGKEKRKRYKRWLERNGIR